jgi:hypothetical protein
LSADFFDTSALAKLYHPEVGTPSMILNRSKAIFCRKTDPSWGGRRLNFSGFRLALRRADPQAAEAVYLPQNG